MKSKTLILYAAVAFSIVAFLTINNRKDDTMTTENTQQYKEVRAQHILVADENKATELLKDIKDGKISFEDCAKKESKCPSGRDGGDLGFFKRGMMVKEFEDAAFSTNKGELSAPVQTTFGWHLIKVTDKR